MTDKPDILCFSSTDWDGWWGSRQQVMRRLARRGYRVLYVEQLAGLEHLLRYRELRQRRLHRWQQGLIQVEDRVWTVSPPPLLPGRYYAHLLNQMNLWLVKFWLQPTVKKLGFSNPILWLYKPEQGGLIGEFNERLCVYHCIDEWTAGSTGRKREIISQMDHQLASKADLVFANSPPTHAQKVQINPRTVRLPSGVDLENFAYRVDEPSVSHPALDSIPKPRIGYSGTINERLDYDALERVAASHPEWSLVFVGDPYPWKMTAPALQRLSAYSNVHFVGRYPPQEMPALIQSMDVCLLPYIDDERGHYRSPLKLYEYLAMGKPVVSLDHPEAREFGAVIYIAKDSDAFVHAVSQAMAENTPELQKSRVMVAQQHSWENRVDQIEAALGKSLGNSL